MKGEMNPKLEPGDVVVCYHMQDELGVPPGTSGVVKDIVKDPFEKDGQIINVNWENGSKLSLLSTTDFWKKLGKTKITENLDYDYLVEQGDIFDNFDWRFFMKFLEKIRKSGIINMFAVSPLLYSGKNYIDRYYGEGKEDDELFQSVLEDADEAKDKMIQGVVKYMMGKNMSLEDVEKVNRFAQNFAMKMFGVYASMKNVTG